VRGLRSAASFLPPALRGLTERTPPSDLSAIVAAKENASRYGYSISPNRELVALGAANIVSSVFGGLPSGFGSLTRSRLAGEFGARTPMAGVVTAGVIVFSMNFLLGSLFYLPKCVLVRCWQSVQSLRVCH
jgi:MFS superfamily sulfate permease-like transporter